MMPTVIKCLSHIKALHLTLLLSFCSPLWAELPQPKNLYINDFANILEAHDYQKIEKQLKNLREKSGIEMTIVTLSSMGDYITIEKDDSKQIDIFTAKLFKSWSLSNQTTNKGIMILIASKERQIKIKFGQLYLFKNEAEIQKAIDLMYANFMNNNYSQGFAEGIENTIRIMQEGSIEGNVQVDYIYILITFISTFAVITIFAVISLITDRKNGWGWAFFTYLFFIVFWWVRKIRKK